MTVPAPAVGGSVRGRLGAKLWGFVLAAWAVVAGAAPHVLHHIGPLAGAALLAGISGKAVFFALGAILSLPLLRRIYRRFETWIAPALALAAFAAMFVLSSSVIAPRLTADDDPATPLEQPSHNDHHGGTAGKR